MVFDKWKASVSAIDQLGYRHAPPINHSITWRDVSTGFYSNDVESEFNRVKVFVRERYSRLKFEEIVRAGSDEGDEDIADIDEGDLCEYTYYANVGRERHHVMEALRFANGGACPPYRF